VFKAASLPQGPPNKNGAGTITQSIEGLYPLYGAKFEPWSWYDASQPIGDPSLNVGASQTKGMLYIDTVMSYTAPRFYEIIKNTTACQITAGIDDQKTDNSVGFTTVPNPSSSTITIFSSSVGTAISSATLIDFNGRVVRTIENNKNYFAVLPVEDLANGMYAIEIKTANGIQSVKKVIVQH
jgi:hypothetical protein